MPCPHCTTSILAPFSTEGIGRPQCELERSARVRVDGRSESLIVQIPAPEDSLERALAGAKPVF